MTNNHFLNIGVLLYGCGHHQAAWRMKDSNIEDIGNISYYQHLAQIAEKAFWISSFLQTIKPLMRVIILLCPLFGLIL